MDTERYSFVPSSPAKIIFSMNMNYILKIGLVVILTASLSCSPSANEEKPPKQYSVSQFMDIVQIGGSSFSPDENKISL